MGAPVVTSFAQRNAGRALSVGFDGAASYAAGMPRYLNLLIIQPAARLVAGTSGWMTRGGATSSPRRRRAPFTLGNLLPAEVPGGGVLGRRHPFIARENLSLTKRPEPASFALREVSESDPMVGVVHVSNMERPNVRVVASAHVNPRR